mgnify:CR=1 FL=1
MRPSSPSSQPSVQQTRRHPAPLAHTRRTTAAGHQQRRPQPHPTHTRHKNHKNIQVGAYKGAGTTTTPFDKGVRNGRDRFDLVLDVIDRVPGLGERAARVHQHMLDKRAEHRMYTRETGEDLPELRDWVWPG